jgi:hypothetical protein
MPLSFLNLDEFTATVGKLVMEMDTEARKIPDLDIESYHTGVITTLAIVVQTMSELIEESEQENKQVQ